MPLPYMILQQEHYFWFTLIGLVKRYRQTRDSDIQISISKSYEMIYKACEKD